jgi:cytochrome c551/c552
MTFLPFGFAQSTPAASKALLDKYCVTCHNDRIKTGGLTLEKIDVANIPANAETWEKVIRKLRVGAMPPSGMPKPGASDVTALLSSLETSLDKAYAANPNPGHATLHRLNRTEYANSVRDLLSLDVDASTLLPPDDESCGAFRPYCWSAMCPHRAKSAGWRLAISRRAPSPKHFARGPIFRRTSAWKGCRLERAAAY